MNTTRLIALCSLALSSGSPLAAPVERATVPLYDAQTLAKACSDALALAKGMVNALQALPMKRVTATDMSASTRKRCASISRPMQASSG
jgi:hypothetical protein